jgi:twinkle protein
MTQENIEEIKSKAGIVDVVGSYLKLKKQGANYISICPFHAEKSGSFTVSQSKGIYKCFGCGKSGDVISFIMEKENKNFPESVELLAAKYNIELDKSEKKQYTKPVERLEKLSIKMIDWFEKDRAISNDTLLRMKITEAKEWMPQHEKEVPVICFNYYENESLVNIKFRGPKKSFKLAKDAKLLLYNIDSLKKEESGIIVEGEIDAMSCVEAGIYNVVAVPNGTPPVGTKLNLEYLDNCWQSFRDIKKIILAGDNDEVGLNLRNELARRLGKERCWTVEYPEGCKDFNDVLVKHGKESVKEIINNARQWPLEGIKSMDDIYPTIADWYLNGYPDGDCSGVAGMDNLLRFAPKFITTVTGIPGHGKDEFLNGIMAGLATKSQWKFGICGFEETPAETASKIAEKLVNKAFAFRNDPGNRMNQKELEWAIGFLDQNFFFFDTEEAETTVDGIINKATELVLRHGINGLYINPWNWIEHNRENGVSETEYVSIAYSKLIRFARKYDVHIFLVAHTTKMEKEKDKNKYKIPTLYSISGSANFFNKTHNGICVYRDFESGMVDVYVQKVKQSWFGEIGFNSYSFNTLTRQYEFSSTNFIDKNKNFKGTQFPVFKQPEF